MTDGLFNRRQIVGGGIAGAALGAPTIVQASRSGEALAQTRQGMVRGRRVAGIAAFKGLRYGAPTGGANRFLPPRPPLAWEGVRDAFEWGETAPQRKIARYPVLESWDRGFDDAPQGEDCLVLNLWTPGLDRARRPVMLYLHGGGFTGRSGSRDIFDGANLARASDVVVVTINQRLNVFGYGYLGHLDPLFADSGNLGTLDAIAALRWVRDNIAAFGGDPGSVTLFGQSGGGQKISTLLASPAATGLFHKAIIQSGSFLQGATLDEAKAAGSAFLDALGIAPAAARQVQQVPWQRIVAVMAGARGTPYADRNFVPVIDGRTLPAGPWYPDAPAVSAQVPLIIGTTRTETTMLLGSADPAVFALDEAGLLSRLATWTAPVDPASMVAAFRRIDPQADPTRLFFAVTTALRFHRPAVFQAMQRVRQPGAAPVWFYEIDWATPVDGGKWGAPHSMDHGFTFRNIAGGESMYGDTPPATLTRLADQIGGAWAAFARHGRPDHRAIPAWPAFDAARQATMRFDLTSRVERRPLAAELAAVAAVPVVTPGGDLLTRALR